MLVHSEKHINEVDRGVEAAEQLGEVLIHAHPVAEDAIQVGICPRILLSVTTHSMNAM